MEMATEGLITENLGAFLEQQATGQNLDSLIGVYLICSYITTSGWQELTPVFKSFAERRPPVPLRVFTTSQFGHTDPAAIHRLSLLPETKVKVFIKERNPTFHAKGWLFLRKEGHSLAVVGSSNASESAMTEAIEFNTWTTATDIVAKFRTSFEEYWSADNKTFNDQTVLEYTPNRWEELLNHWPTVPLPECNDINADCNHLGCLRLKADLRKLEEQRASIMQSFNNRDEAALRKRRLPPENLWDVPEGNRPKRVKTGLEPLQGDVSLSRLDAMDMDTNDSATPFVDVTKSPVKDLQRRLIDAIWRREKEMVQVTIKAAKRGGHDLMRGSSDVQWSKQALHNYDSIIRGAEGRSPPWGKGYDLYQPLLFAIIDCRDPEIIDIILRENPQAAYDILNAKAEGERNNIFHVLAYLHPPEACPILKGIQQCLLQNRIDPEIYKGRSSPLDVARASANARNSRRPDLSFYTALEEYEQQLRQ